MGSNFRKVLWIICVIVIIFVVWVMYQGGYRFSSLSAAKAHFDVEKSATDFGEVDLQWGKVYLFNTSVGPRTVLSEKKGFLWQAPAAVHFTQSSDNIRTVGWMGYSGKQGQATILAVESSDPQVSYIEAGSIKKGITVEEPVIFSWNKVQNLDDLKPKAISKEGKVLYEYRFPKDSAITNTDDLKWYPVTSSQ